MARLQDIAWARKVFDRDGHKRLGHNTHLYSVGGFNGASFNGWTLKYHSTHVVEFVEYPEINARRLTIDTGGWFSVTTLQRVRHGLAELGLRLDTHDLPGKWRVMCGRGQAFTIRGNRIVLRQEGEGEWQRVG